MEELLTVQQVANRLQLKPSFGYHAPLGRRQVVGQFDGGDLSSDGGGLLLREVEQRTGIGIPDAQRLRLL